MTSTQPLQRSKAVVDRVLGGVLATLMGALVLDVLWQVFTRFVLQNPSSFTDELARFLLIWVGLLGAAYAAGQRMHLAIDLLPSALTGQARHALAAVIELVVIVFSVGALMVGGGRLVSLTLMLGQSSAALGVPLGYVYLVLPLSGTIIAFYGVVFLLEHLRALRSGGDEIPVETGAARAPGETLTSKQEVV